MSDPTPTVGDTITIRLENVSNHEQETGTDGKVAIQRRIDGEWRSLLFVGPNFGYDGAAAIHEPGEGFAWTVTLTEAGISPMQNDHVCRAITAGTYRFVYWGASGDANPGVKFEVTPTAGSTRRTADRKTDTTVQVTESTTGDATETTGAVQRRISLANVDDVPDEHDVEIGVELLKSTVTSEHTARLRVTATDESSRRRRLTIGTGQCSLFNRGKGQSDPKGLWLHAPATSEHIDREGDRWTADRDPEDSQGFGAYGCGYAPSVHDEPIVNEYLVWDDYRVEGYMTPGTYRFAVSIEVGGRAPGSTTTTATEPGAEFTWGFDLAVENPNA